MTWERIPRGATTRSSKPSIGIQKNGRITWNKGAHEALGSPDHVELLLDSEGKRLGLRKAKSEHEDAFPVRKTKNQNTWGMSALGALRSIGIRVDKAYRKIAKTDEEVVFISIEDLPLGA